MTEHSLLCQTPAGSVVSRLLSRYRFDTMGQAKASAASYGYEGAKFSWESSSSGAEVSSGPGCSGKGYPCPGGAGPNGCGVR